MTKVNPALYDLNGWSKPLVANIALSQPTGVEEGGKVVSDTARKLKNALYFIRPTLSLIAECGKTNCLAGRVVKIIPGLKEFNNSLNLPDIVKVLSNPFHDGNESLVGVFNHYAYSAWKLARPTAWLGKHNILPISRESVALLGKVTTISFVAMEIFTMIDSLHKILKSRKDEKISTSKEWMVVAEAATYLAITAIGALCTPPVGVALAFEFVPAAFLTASYLQKRALAAPISAPAA